MQNEMVLCRDTTEVDATLRGWAEDGHVIVAVLHVDGLWYLFFNKPEPEEIEIKVGADGMADRQASYRSRMGLDQQ